MTSFRKCAFCRTLCGASANGFGQTVHVCETCDAVHVTTTGAGGEQAHGWTDPYGLKIAPDGSRSVVKPHWWEVA